MNQDFCYIVQVLSGSTDHGSVFVLDSVWDNEELAEEYCSKKYKDWPCDISKHYFNNPT